MVPVTEVQPRTITKCVVNCVPVTTTATRCVDRGHWECREVAVPCAAPASACGHGCGGRKGLLGGLFHGRKHHGGGCETACASPCDTCAAPVECAPTYVTRTVRTWVPNIVTETYPVTRLERQVSTVTETVNVTVCKMVPKEETYQVTVNKIVPETKTETVTVMVCKTVPYEAVRTVAKCVPVTENVQACRMVARTVEKMVPVTCATTSCCGATAAHGCGGGHKLFGGHGGGHRLFGGHHRGGCCD
jgi:hypothetical protein